MPSVDECEIDSLKCQPKSHRLIGDGGNGGDERPRMNFNVRLSDDFANFAEILVNEILN